MLQISFTEDNVYLGRMKIRFKFFEQFFKLQNGLKGNVYFHSNSITIFTSLLCSILNHGFRYDSFFKSSKTTYRILTRNFWKVFLSFFVILVKVCLFCLLFWNVTFVKIRNVYNSVEIHNPCILVYYFFCVLLLIVTNCTWQHFAVLTQNSQQSAGLSFGSSAVHT